MARGNRLREIEGGIYHVTHRCHNHAFLLRFAQDRNEYRRRLRRHLQEVDLSLLDYCVTCNHVHLLIDTADRRELGGLMRMVEGESARVYNRRKNRCNAFWGDNYHATLVETGEYLWRCVCYIELNMVRAGVVKHPREWDWVGYHEITGAKRRNRLLDLERLCWRVGAENLDELRRHLDVALVERIQRDELRREPIWTESVAVGSRDFLEKIEPTDVSRCRVELAERSGDIWFLREEEPSYGLKNTVKNRSIDRKSGLNLS